MTLLITSLLGGINQRRVVNMYEVLGPQCIAILPDTRESHCFISSSGDNVRLRIRDHITSHHRDRHRRGIRPTNCLYIVTFWLVTNLPHDMMTQDPGCGHGTASHCRINLTHVTIGPRRGGGLVTDGGLLTVILMQRATKVTLNTQHSTLNTHNL